MHKIAKLSATVLILGESGTGKELLARLIHREAGDPDAPFIAVNLAAIPRELAESALFGHERGAFTGAHRQQLGKFELASNGTLFLDEIGDLRLDLQAKLLRAIQEGEIERVGGHQADQDRVPADRRDQRRPREGGQGRPLPRRPLLPDQRHPDQAAAAARTVGGHPAARRVFPAALQRAVPQEHPGHHRLDDGDAEEVLVAGQHPRAREPDRAARRGERQGLHLARRTCRSSSTSRSSSRRVSDGENLFEEATNTFERNFILRALEKCGWNVTGTAEYLGIPLSTLKYKMDKLDVRQIARRVACRGARHRKPIIWPIAAKALTCLSQPPDFAT